MRKQFISWQVKVAGIALLLLGSIGLGALTVLGQQGPIGGQPEHGPIDTRTGLLARGRDRLLICVQGVGSVSSVAPTARQRIEEALSAVAGQHPNWNPAGYGRVARAVQIGCPMDPHLLRPGVEYVNGRPGPANAGERALQAQTASPFRLYVFVLPPDDLTRVIRGEFNVRTAAQEVLCDDGRCAEVTTGLYLTPGDLTNAPLLQEWVAKGLGLEPPYKLPEDKRPPTGR